MALLLGTALGGWGVVTTMDMTLADAAKVRDSEQIGRAIRLKSATFSGIPN